MKIRLLLIGAILSTFTSVALAQKFQPAGEEWIEHWWGMDLIINNGGFAASANRDWLDEGTNGKITDASVTTPKGLAALQGIKSVNLDKQNGGELKWDIVTIDTNDGNNMSTSHGLPPSDNIEWYGLIVIKSPNSRKTTMHPAHDDHAHIWLNGEKVYNNPQWTGGVTTVTTPTDVNFKKGENILLFRCGESGGSDYVNLHFESTDKDLKILPTTDGKFFELTTLSVDPSGKLATTWGDMKQR